MLTGVTFLFFFWKGRLVHMPMNTAIRGCSDELLFDDLVSSFDICLSVERGVALLARDGPARYGRFLWIRTDCVHRSRFWTRCEEWCTWKCLTMWRKLFSNIPAAILVASILVCSCICACILNSSKTPCNMYLTLAGRTIERLLIDTPMYTRCEHVNLFII